MNFTQWLRLALRGEEFIYHTGLLMADRQQGDDALAADLAGKLAWRAYEAGRVSLTQRRATSTCSEYIATRL